LARTFGIRATAVAAMPVEARNVLREVLFISEVYGNECKHDKGKSRRNCEEREGCHIGNCDINNLIIKLLDVKDADFHQVFLLYWRRIEGWFLTLQNIKAPLVINNVCKKLRRKRI
jgi:hypothetical protein